LDLQRLLVVYLYGPYPHKNSTTTLLELGDLSNFLRTRRKLDRAYQRYTILQKDEDRECDFRIEAEVDAFLATMLLEMAHTRRQAIEDTEVDTFVNNFWLLLRLRAGELPTLSHHRRLAINALPQWRTLFRPGFRQTLMPPTTQAMKKNVLSSLAAFAIVNEMKRNRDIT
jgi:hypothetical protein